MATTPWATLQLCSRADIEDEISDLLITLQSNGVDLAATVERKLTTAKNRLRQDLMVRLPEVFVASASVYGYTGTFTNWLTRVGYSYDELDRVLDYIANPEELKPVAVAYTIRALLIDGQSRFRATYEMNDQTISPMLTFWDRECQSRMTVAFKLLKIDLNQDGTITDQERVRANKTFWPV